MEVKRAMSSGGGGWMRLWAVLRRSLRIVVCLALRFGEAGAEPMQRLMHDVPGPESNERMSPAVLRL